MYTSETVYLILMFVLTPISVGTMGIVAWWVIKQQDNEEDSGRIKEIWQKREVWGEKTCRQLIDHQVTVSMTPEMVELAWGKPKAIKHKPEKDSDYWLYDATDLDESDSYIWFKNDRVAKQVGNAPEKPMLSLSPWTVISILFGLAIIITIIVIVVVVMMSS